VVGIRVREHDGIDHAMSAVPQKAGDQISSAAASMHGAGIEQQYAVIGFNDHGVTVSYAENSADQTAGDLVGCRPQGTGPTAAGRPSPAAGRVAAAVGKRRRPAAECTRRAGTRRADREISRYPERTEALAATPRFSSSSSPLKGHAKTAASGGIRLPTATKQETGDQHGCGQWNQYQIYHHAGQCDQVKLRSDEGCGTAGRPPASGDWAAECPLGCCRCCHQQDAEATR
jgi:hypothetical protein